MSQPDKWWWGLLVPLVLFIVADVGATGLTEDDLHAKTAIVPWAQASVSGRDVEVGGTAPSEEAKTKALQAIDAVPGIRRVRESGIKVLAVAKPYRFEATRQGDTLTLKGFYPDDAAHAAVLAAARQAMPNLKVSDEMALAPGFPDGFVDAAKFGLIQLAGLASGTASLEDSKYSITGAAANAAAYSGEIARAKTPPAGFSLALASISPPVQKPYAWSASKAGSQIVLSGYVPSDDARGKLIEAVKAANPSAEIVDKQFVAAGQPNGYAAMTAYAVAQLSKLTGGSVTLDDASYAINGEAPSLAVFDASLAATKTLPVGFTLKDAKISPPLQKPYSWSATREGNAITLAGFVPSQEQRDATLNAVKTAFPDAKVSDTQVLAYGQPQNLSAIITFGIGQLAKLSSGRAAVEDSRYSIGGEAPSAEVADAVIAAAKNLPQGFGLASAAVIGKAAIAPPPPPQLPPPGVTTPPPAPVLPPSDRAQVESCQKSFSAELGESAVYFDTAKDTFRQVSYAVLDRLVEIARTCPNVNVEIAAFTDNVGDAQSNQALSERRALAVLTYLKQRIPVDRYRAIGYGETQPIASNDTDEGRQKNRRVEFVVK